MQPELVLVLALAIYASFVVSASVGLGGSLVLVPVLVLAIGPREGVALAALLLAGNNVLKVIAYRATLPLRQSAMVLGCTIVGVLAGATALTRAPQDLVMVAVIASLALSLTLELRGASEVRRATSPALALAAGATSGFSGTSGPLKGVAVKNLGLDRLHTVGAASIVSLGGDLTKTAVFTEAGLLGPSALLVAAVSVPLMVLGTWTGRRLTGRLGERRWAALFWLTMVGYSARLMLS
jgi:uncharacterized membrane protein YfcA